MKMSMALKTHGMPRIQKRVKTKMTMERKDQNRESQKKESQATINLKTKMMRR